MRIKRMIFALTALLLSGMTTAVPVFAQTSKEAGCVCEEKCTESSINNDCAVCCGDYKLCQGTEKEKTDQESEVLNTSPLTPEGNMTLVDDIETDSEDTSKQFFTVTSKDGHYFYIIIDRDSQGNNTVHFLNQVDEADLLNLMEEEDVKAYQAALDAQESKESEKSSILPQQEETKTDEETEAEEEEKAKTKEKKQSKAPLAAGLVIICLMLAAGGIFWYSSHKGKRQESEDVEDPDADYREDEEYELQEEQESNGETSDVTQVSADTDDDKPENTDSEELPFRSDDE